MRIAELSPYWKHLRIPYSLTLAPIFLWGYFLARPHSHDALLPAFAAFHFFLYPGITAYNSAYDRDEGPVGGMLHPPRVPGRLLPFSIAVQSLGAILAALAGSAVVAVYLTIALLGFGYSHPLIRWKADPVASSLVVALGQGGLGCFAGWAAAHGGFSSREAVTIAGGCFAAAMTTLGLYPMSQVFQIEEDAKRGDRTLAVTLGPVGALRFGIASLVAAALATVALMAFRHSFVDAALMVGAYAFTIWQVSRFAKSYRDGRATTSEAFWTSTRLSWTTSAGFLVFIVGHLIGLL